MSFAYLGCSEPVDGVTYVTLVLFMHPPSPTTQEEYIINAYHYRGMFIDKFCFLEVQIESYLAQSFIVDSKNMMYFKSIILDRLTFESKRTAFRALLLKHNPDTNHKKLLDEIRKLNEKRVQFAHYYLALHGNRRVSDIVIMLTEYRDSIDIISYTVTQFDAVISRMEFVIKQILQLRRDNFQP